MTNTTVTPPFAGVPISDLIYRLEAAANTIHTVPVFERRDLIERGVLAIHAHHADISRNGNNITAVRSGWLAEMGILSEMAAREDAVAVLIAADVLDCCRSGAVAGIDGLDTDALAEATITCDVDWLNMLLADGIASWE